MKGLSKKSNKYVEYHFVKEYDKKLSRGGIAAWDYGRYVFLCRDGAYVGYISDEEAWELMLRIAKLAKEDYSSWREYGLAYIAGRQFWLDQLSEESADNQLQLVSKLMLDEESPWCKIDWNTDIKSK